jgi:hypothetical protein
MNQALVSTLPSQVTPRTIRRLQDETAGRQMLLERIVAQFERRYSCSLDVLEARLACREIEEHPAWEDSIEWRNAVEQLQAVEVNQSILAWLNGLLSQSPDS